MDRHQQVEYIARAFYEAQDNAQTWEDEPEATKEDYRNCAQAAIALLEEYEKGKAFGLTEAA